MRGDFYNKEYVIVIKFIMAPEKYIHFEIDKNSFGIKTIYWIFIA